MKISIFHGRKPNQMKFVDDVVDVDFDSIQKVITSKAWSPSVFKTESGKQHRKNINLDYTGLFGVDIDDGCSIEEAIKVINNYNLRAIIGTTKSHQKPKQVGETLKPPCDRFRIIFFLDRQVATDLEYKSIFNKFKKLFPTCDDACKDSARFYFPCKEIVFTNLGNLFEVPTPEVLNPKNTSTKSTKSATYKFHNKGKISDKTVDFIMNGAPDGEWHNRLISALFNLKECGYSKAEATDQIDKATLSAHGELDEHDLKQIEDIYENRVEKNPYRETTQLQDSILEKVEKNLEKMVQMSEVLKKPVDFLWNPYFAKGFVSLFTGDPGSGKSTIMAHIVAAISNGGKFWDGQNASLGNIVIFQAEDPLEEVYKPRLDRANANSSNVFAFTAPIEFDEVGKKTIREAVLRFFPSILIIDPLVAYIGANVDTSKANEVRAKMLFLSELAKEFGIAIVVIRHCAKGTANQSIPLIYKGHGSVDFVAAVRSEVMLITDPKNEGFRYFGHTKSNLTKFGKTLYFHFTDNGPVLNRIEDKSLSQIFLDENLDSKNETALNDVIEAINTILASGPKTQLSLFEELKSSGFTQPTIRRGIKSIQSISSERIGFVGKSRGSAAWVYCTEKQYQDLKAKKFEHLEQLNEYIANFPLQDAQNSTGFGTPYERIESE